MMEGSQLDEAAKAKRDLINLRRRERRAGQSTNQLRIDGKEEAQRLLAIATDNAKAAAEKILEEARRDAVAEAKLVIDAAREEATALREQLSFEFFQELGALNLQIQELQKQNKELQLTLRRRQHTRKLLAQEARIEHLQAEVNDLKGCVSQMGDHVPSDVAAKRAAATLRQRKCRARKRFGDDIALQDSISEIPNRGRRNESTIVGEIVERFQRLTKFHNLASKKSIMKRFWTHKRMSKLHPTSLGSTKADLSWRLAATDLKNTLSIVKNARRKDHKAAKDILLSSLTGKQVVSSRYQAALAKALCVKRAPIAKASKTRDLLDGDELLRYPSGQRKERSDRLSSVIQGDISWFWEVHTRVSPNNVPDARKRIAAKEYITHRVHWLEDTEAEYFFKFREWVKNEGKQYTVGLRSFQALKPYFIRTMKDRNVCCCKQHVETQLLCKAFFRQRQMLHPPDCSCTCVVCIPPLVFEGPVERDGTPPTVEPQEQICQAHKCSLPSVRKWAATTLCKKGESDIWNKRDCLVGICEDCGPDLPTLCPWEYRLDEEVSVTWETYEYVVLDDLPMPHKRHRKGQSQDDGLPKKVKKRLRLVKKTTSMHTFMEKVFSTLMAFVKHDFYARWQGEQYRNCLKRFPKGTVVSSIDFAENYTFAVQDEVQSLHWDNRQITILVLITYRHQHDREEDDPIAYDGQGQRITRFMEADYHFFISDDNSHDTFFVQYCLDFHWQWMKEQGFVVDKHIMWSDGCAAQFKACRPFSYVAKYYQTHGARMMWCFHASGHGKGVQDGLGGGVKSAIRKEQLRTEGGHPMEGAADVVAFLKTRFCLGKEMEYDKKQGVRRFFWEIGLQEVQRTSNTECLPIKGVRQLHCFMGYSKDNPMMLKCRELACFCDKCVADAEKDNQCENQAHVLPWDVDHVFPLHPRDVARVIEDLHPGGMDADGANCENHLGDLVQVGDFFAVLAEEGNEWQAEFYILLCTEMVTTVDTSFTDDYGAQFLTGDRVLAGTWYQQYGKSDNSFVRYEKASVSYVDVASVVYIKFGLVPTKVVSGSPGFKLSSQTLDAILESTQSANPSISDMNL